MNKSVDERLIRPGEYIDAMNVRLGSTEGSEIGAVENSKGNTRLTDIDFDGQSLSGQNPTCIGAYADSENDTIYWFVTSDIGDLILSYDVRNNNLTKHIESYTVLNFSDKHLITGVDKIEDLLYFTDNLNPPRKINVSRDYKFPENGVDKITDEEINLIVKPPSEAPSASLRNSPGEENYLETRFVSFAYRYRYVDGEYSALSQFTDVAFEPSQFRFNLADMNNEGMKNIYNSVNVSFNTGPQDVVGVDVCFKIPESNVINVIEKIDKEGLGYPNNSTQSLTFNNGKIYTTLTESELLRLYDNVPLTAKSLVLMGNRLMFGNYIEGYDISNESGAPINIDFDTEIVTTNPGASDLEETFSSGVYNFTTGQNSISIPQSKVTFDFSGLDLKAGSLLQIGFEFQHNTFAGETSGSPSVTAPIDENFSFSLQRDYANAFDLVSSAAFQTAIGASTRFGSPNVQPISSCGTSSQGFSLTERFVCAVDSPRVDNTFTWVKDEFGVNTAFQGVVVTATPGSNIFSLQFPAIRFKDDTTTPGTVYNLFEYFSVFTVSPFFSSSASKKSLHSNRDYEVGIVYMDEYNRSSTALVSSNNSVYTSPSSSTAINQLKVTLNSLPPSWATKYKFVVKRVQSDYETIYSNLSFKDPNSSSVFFQLLGQNQTKVKSGDELIVKRDLAGTISRVVETQVLSLEAKSKDFLDNETSGGDEVPEPSGLYMEVRPDDFIASRPLDEVVVIKNPSSFGKGDFAVTWQPAFDESQDLQPADPYYNAYAIPAGSTVEFRLKFYRDSGFQKRCGSVYYDYGLGGDEPKIFTASADYDSLYQFVIGENINFEGGVKGGNDDDDPQNQSITFYPTLATDLTTAGGFEISESKTGGRNHQLQFVQPQNPGFITPITPGRMYLVGMCGIKHCPFQESSKIKMEIIVTLAQSLCVFETKPLDADVDIYYEGSENYNITGGFHMSGSQSGDQNQTASQPAIMTLSFFDCFSFGNGVESYKVLDNQTGAKFYLGERVTSVSEQDYKRAHRFAGLTYSGIFRNETNVNRLNEFNLGLANFKDLEKNYGSIQKLAPRETDLLVLQEDRVSYVLAGKNLLSDAAAGGAITSVPEVLGTQIARLEEYGISQNPESFASFGYDKYFTDTSRGAVIQLRGSDYSNEKLEVISQAGMRSYFRDKFQQGFETQKLGGYDPYMNEYVLGSNDQPIPIPIPESGCGTPIIIKDSDIRPYSFIVNFGEVIGDATIDYTSTVDLSLDIIYNGSTTTYSLLAGTSSVIFSKDFAYPTTAEFRVTPSQRGDYTITPNCVDAAELTVIQVAITSPEDEDKYIHNQYQWELAPNPASPLSSTQIEFGGLPAPVVSQYQSGTGKESVGLIPADGSTITIISNKLSNDDFVFDENYHNFRYLVSNTLYQNTSADITSLLVDPNLTVATPTSNPSTGKYQASFTYNNPSDHAYLYLVWDYRNVNAIELCTSTISANDVCCECTSKATFYIDAPFLSQASSVYTNPSLTQFAPDQFYSDGTISRYQSNGILQDEEPCITCVVDCGTLASATQVAGTYIGDISLTTLKQPVVIYFRPANTPLGVRAGFSNSTLQNQFTYNNNSGDPVGINSNSGEPTYIGTPFITPETTSNLPTFKLNSSGSYINPGFPLSTVTVDPANIDLKGGDPTIYTMVLPWTGSTNVAVDCFGVDDGEFNWIVNCPAPLPSFDCSAAQLNNNCTPNNTENTFFFARNATWNGSSFVEDTNNKPIVGNYVFEDYLATTKLNDTLTAQFYILSDTTYIKVKRGIVIEVGDCFLPTVPCSSTPAPTSSIQGESYSEMNFEGGSNPGDTGAMIVYFNPRGIPDGVRVLYDGAYYNKMAFIGDLVPAQGSTDSSFTIVGDPTDSLPNPPFPNGPTTSFALPFYSYDPSTQAWIPSGSTKTATLSAGDDARTANTNFEWGTIVVPKPNQFPSTVLVESIGISTGTVFDIATFCPVALPSFSSTPVQSDGSCNPLTETFYFARNADQPGTGQISVRTNTVPEQSNWVFTDENGENLLPDGYYTIDSAGGTNPDSYIYVLGGIVQSVTSPCITPPTHYAITLEFDSTAIDLTCGTPQSDTFYIANGTTFANATALFTDIGATNPAADAFYKEAAGTFYREQSSGVLFPQQSLPNCYIPVSVVYDSDSSVDVCCLSLTPNTKYVSALEGGFYSATVLYDNTSLTTPSADGFYLPVGQIQYREQSSSALQTAATCLSCAVSLTLDYSSVSAQEVCCDPQQTRNVFMARVDGNTFADATDIYTDDTLTTKAAAGFYKENLQTTYREQTSGGVLQSATACPSCVTAITLEYSSVDATDLCCNTKPTATYYIDGSSFDTTTNLYSDTNLTPAADGFYQVPTSGTYREQSSSTLGVVTTCPVCADSVNLFFDASDEYTLCCGSPALDTYYLPAGTNFDTTPLANTLYSDTSQTLATPGLYKSSNGQYRELDAQGVLGSLEPCPTCPPAAPCSTSSLDIPVGRTGYYNVDVNVGSDVGAIQIFFDPVGVPDGVRVIYNGQVYNTVVDPRISRFVTLDGVSYQVNGGVWSDPSGGFIICGRGDQGAGSTNCGAEYVDYAVNDPVQEYNYFNGFQNNTWLQGNPSRISYTYNINNIPGGDNGGLSSPGALWTTRGARYWLFGTSTWNSIVIPKTSPFVQTIQIQVLGGCRTSQTLWDAFGLCPAALPSFQASVRQTSSVCAAATETYYFTPLPPFRVGMTAVNEYLRGNDLPDFPITYMQNSTSEYGFRQVFKDPNGVTPMDDGWYASGTGKTIQVENGIVIAYIDCT